MTNANTEFLAHIEDRKVKCACIHDDGDRYGEAKRNEIILPVGYTEVDYIRFQQQLNFDYDSGYGGQNLFGTIWYEDGSWSERGEYDGSEWWEHKECPAIPENVAGGIFDNDQTLLIEV